MFTNTPPSPPLGKGRIFLIPSFTRRGQGRWYLKLHLHPAPLPAGRQEKNGCSICFSGKKMK
ncbi:MAG: hypothetical protein A2X59_03800 [Nitrospirae bacterium GWC2_42_7]|nr:MAG: hypothetical protein A2X59_03800 [Nitrospirae bacterium GWC2_42_7]